MQCHKCPYDGKGDRRCLECKASEYLGNGWRRMVHPDSIDELLQARDVMPMEDDTASDEMDGILNDCRNVLRTLRGCGASSLPYVLRLFLLFASLTPDQFSLVKSVLDGRTLCEHAKEHGVSKQAVQQRWMRMVGSHPELKGVLNGARVC